MSGTTKPALSEAILREQERQQRVKSLHPLKKLFAAGVAGMVGVSCIFPLDTAKTLMQAGLYPNMKAPFMDLVPKYGFLRMYKGLPANLVGIMPEKAIKITVNDLVRRALGCDDTGKGSIGAEVVAGAVAGACQIVVTTPMELFKILMQADSTKPFSVRWREVGGLRGMYRGVGATFSRDVPFSMVYFALFAKGKQYLCTKFERVGPFESLLASTSAGIVAAWLLTPADCIKTVIQNSQTPLTMTQTARMLYAEGGVKRLFRGATVRVLTIAPLFGIALMVYDTLTRSLA